MMKALGIALLVANVLLVAWQYSRHVDHLTIAAITANPLPADAPPIVMLADLDELPELKVPAPAADPDAEALLEVFEHLERSNVCLNIGPMPDADARDKLREWLREYSAVLKVRAESIRTRQFFWVYLEPSADEVAQRNLNDLIERGVTDYLLIRRGNLKNAISLGLFRSQDSVSRRLSELNEKGYKPVVVPQFETIDHYWISAQLATDYADGVDLPPSLLGQATVESVGCDSI